MNSHLRTSFLLLGLIAGGSIRLSAQSLPTASRQITPSIFLGCSGVETGLQSDKNLSITVGVDLSFLPKSRIQPAFEYRGMVAVAGGQVDTIKNSFVGVRLAPNAGRIRPYGDVLVGREQTNYSGYGFAVPSKSVIYTESASNLLSLGGGVDVFATRQFALKIDVQLQRSASPVTASGHVNTEVGTVGVVYVFHIGRHAYGPAPSRE